MAAKTILRWFLPKADPPMVQSVMVATEEQLAIRNQERLEQAKRTLGGRYVLHPSNAVARQERPRTLTARASKPVQVNSKRAPQSRHGADPVVDSTGASPVSPASARRQLSNFIA